MNSFYTHISFFVFLGLVALLSIVFATYISYLGEAFHFSLDLFSFWNMKLSLSFFFDRMSIWFFSVVLIISSIIIVYSYHYISPYSKSNYFLWMTVLFIISILLLIRMSNLFFLMLGWDGLGLVSFFLIVYYQNSSSLASGVFTLLMNRVGDCFFLVRIALMVFLYPEMSFHSSSLSSTLLILMLLVTFITKRAIYPFSPWLPLAMAAPTPISALVHSSTLVTAGLFLIIRYNYLILSSYWVIKGFLLLSIFTSLYAGLNTIFEKDLKKLIALSTLRHLGFIGIAISVGLLPLAFFHLLVHALFKSLLFISMGDILINLSHSQDIRFLSKGGVYTPFSSFIILVSLLNLLGLPFIGGFFSKDLVLEILNYSSLSWFILFIVYVNVGLTYFYTYQLFFFSFQRNKLSPFFLPHPQSMVHSALMLLLRVLSYVFRVVYLRLIYQYALFLPLPQLLKFIPVGLNVSFMLYLFTNLALRSPTSLSLNYYFSNMMFLSNFIISTLGSLHFLISSSFVKSGELGLFNFTLNSYVSRSLIFISKSLLTQTLQSPLRLLFYSGFFVVLFTTLYVST